MEIKNIDINSIIPYEFNNRIHEDKQINLIANSINEFGFNQPIVIDESNIVLVGHGRLLAAQKLGLVTIPTLQLKNLTEAKKRAYRILDNKLQNDSEWDFGNLELEIEALQDDEFDLVAWGLDSLTELFPKEDPEVSQDEIPEVPKNTYIKTGDLIELGKHRVLCGDSSKSEIVGALMDHRLADVVFTDPPYNLGSNTNCMGHEVNKSVNNLKNNQWDSNFDIAPCLENIFFFSKPSACYYIFSSQFLAPIIWESMKSNGCQFYHFLVWCKPNPMPSLTKKTWNFSSTEMICYGHRKNLTFNYPNNGHALAYWEFNKTPIKEHPTSKPIEVIAHALKCCSLMGYLVFDPFLGSGSTLIAADQLGRICYGMEIDPSYCQVIIERYEKHCEKVGKPFECKINGEVFNGAPRP